MGKISEPQKYQSSFGSHLRRRKQIDVSLMGESMTQQHYKDTCDINKILSNIVKSGQSLPNVQVTDEILDLANIPSYQESLNLVIQAEQKFMQLDPKIRLRFANDPGRFLKFVSDPKNADEMYSLGLAVKKEAPPTLEQTPANEAKA